MNGCNPCFISTKNLFRFVNTKTDFIGYCEDTEEMCTKYSGSLSWESKCQISGV